MKVLGIIVLAPALLYVGILLFAKFFAEKIIFPAPKCGYIQNGEIKFLEIDDDRKRLKVAALWLPAKDAKYTVIYSHGNGEDLGEIRWILENLRAQGLSVLAYDYSGYGMSDGKPSIKRLYACADAAWNYAVNTLKISPKNIAIMGYSLGSAASSHLIKKHGGEIRAFILSGGFSDGVNAVLPFNIIPWKILDNVSQIENSPAPLLLIHGERDRIVPLRNFKKISAAYKGSLTALPVKDYGHINIAKSPSYFENIANFIKNLHL